MIKRVDKNNSLLKNDIINYSVVISFVLLYLGLFLFDFKFFRIGSMLIIIPMAYLILLLIFVVSNIVLEFIVFIIKKIDGR